MANQCKSDSTRYNPAFFRNISEMKSEFLAGITNLLQQRTEDHYCQTCNKFCPTRLKSIGELGFESVCACETDYGYPITLTLLDMMKETISDLQQDCLYGLQWELQEKANKQIEQAASESNKRKRRQSRSPVLKRIRSTSRKSRSKTRKPRPQPKPRSETIVISSDSDSDSVDGFFDVDDFNKLDATIADSELSSDESDDEDYIPPVSKKSKPAPHHDDDVIEISPPTYFSIFNK